MSTPTNHHVTITLPDGKHARARVVYLQPKEDRWSDAELDTIIGGAHWRLRNEIMHYLLLTVLVCSFLTGCMPQEQLVALEPSAPCEEIFPQALLSVPFEQISQGREEAEEWIITHFLTATIEFQKSSTRGSGNIGTILWSEGENTFALVLLTGTKYVSQSSEQHPTLSVILHCYGDPTYYTLEQDVPIGGSLIGNRLDLYYADRGLRFRSSTWGTATTQPYDAAFVMNDVTVVMPVSTVEEYVQKRVSLLRTWPENFTELIPEE